MEQTRALCLYFVVLAWSQLAVAAPPQKDAPPVDPARVQKIKKLIDQLVSPNLPPDVKSEEPDAVYPKGYDREAQRPIDKAIEMLRAEGLVAFPVLIERLEDRRYCCTVSYAAHVNHSVGEVCFQIMERQIDLAGIRYKVRFGADGKTYYTSPCYLVTQYGGQWPPDKAAFEKWWKARSQLSLRSLQIEGLEWTIKEEKKRGFANAKEEESYLKPLLEMLDKLRSGKPVE
jgi:hypothetical protein